MDKNSFYKYQEHRALSGYKCAWLVKEQNETKYSLLVASETVPSIFGTSDSFEFDLLQSPTKGKVAGKLTLDDKEVEVLHNRDMAYRMMKLRDKVLDFVYLDGDLGGYKYTGTLDYRVNDAGADVLRGTITIHPMSADICYHFNLRSEVLEPLYFAEVIPTTVKAGKKINAVVEQKSASVTYSYTKVDDDGTETTATTGDFSAESGVITVDAAASGLYAITASADGYAPWTITVYVEA